MAGYRKLFGVARTPRAGLADDGARAYSWQYSSIWKDTWNRLLDEGPQAQ